MGKDEIGLLGACYKLKTGLKVGLHHPSSGLSRGSTGVAPRKQAGECGLAIGRMKQTLIFFLLSVSVPAALLYPFGTKEGDQECVQRAVDFNSPLFKPEIGFPFGNSLQDALYVSCHLAEHVRDVQPLWQKKITQK